MKHALALLLALLLAAPALAGPAPERVAALRRGINITNWFRYPARPDAAALRSYIGDAALADLRRAGFTFVRLPAQPEFLMAAPERMGWLAEAIGRIERAGLGVVVELHPTSWHLDSNPADRARLASAWRALAPVLARFDPRLTFAEIVNEPVFANDATGWESLQRDLLSVIRAALPAATVVLTGNDWGSLDGLLRLHPVADANVIYSFHLYEPMVLTTLAEFEPSADRTALATLPFPVSQPCIHTAAAGQTPAQTLALMRFYCGEGWTADKLRARIALAADWAQRNHVVVLAGEFGATRELNADARFAWLGTVRRALEEGGIGWALWGYDDRMGFGVARPPGERPALDPELLRVLGLRAPG